MTNIPKSFCKADPYLITNLSMVCKVTLKENKETMINYELERCITNDGNWEHYASLGCDEDVAIEMWHYWQEKQPNYQFRMYKVTKLLWATSAIVNGSLSLTHDGESNDS